MAMPPANRVLNHNYNRSKFTKPQNPKVCAYHCKSEGCELRPRKLWFGHWKCFLYKYKSCSNFITKYDLEKLQEIEESMDAMDDYASRVSKELERIRAEKKG